MIEKTQFPAFMFMFPHVHCSAETLVRRGGITSHHLITYSLTLSNISAKNYQNRLGLMCVEVIVSFLQQCRIFNVFILVLRKTRASTRVTRVRS